MQLESMYQEIILDHYRNPHGRGLREPFEAEVHHVNPTCGDEVTLRVHLEEGETGEAIVSDVSYEGMGCSISQASVSAMDDLEDAIAFAGVSKYPARIKCALMSWMALKDASARALSAPQATGGQD